MCMSDFQQFLNNRHFDHALPGVPLFKDRKKERKKNNTGSAEDISAYDNTL